MIEANEPTLKSWIEVAPNSDFPIQNLPFGVIKTTDGIRVASRIGDFAIDLNAMFVLGYLDNLPFEKSDFDSTSLNAMMGKGKKGTRLLRNRLSKLFRVDTKDLANNEHHVNQILVPMSDVEMLILWI